MKLKIFNSENSAQVRVGTPSFYFAKAGCNTINATAVKAIGLKPGDMVSIAQNEEDPRTFYLFHDKVSGFKLRDYNKSGALAFNSASIAQQAINAAGSDKKTISCRLITEPVTMDRTKYYPIIVPKPQ